MDKECKELFERNRFQDCGGRSRKTTCPPGIRETIIRDVSVNGKRPWRLSPDLNMERIVYFGIDVHKDTNTMFMFAHTDDGNTGFGGLNYGH